MLFTTPIPPKPGAADPRLLRMIARMLRSLADQLDRWPGVEPCQIDGGVAHDVQGDAPAMLRCRSPDRTQELTFVRQSAPCPARESIPPGDRGCVRV